MEKSRGRQCEGKEKVDGGDVMEELGRRVEICELWERQGNAGTVLIVKMER